MFCSFERISPSFQVELYEFQLIILFSSTFHTYIIHFYQMFEEIKPRNDWISTTNWQHNLNNCTKLKEKKQEGRKTFKQHNKTDHAVGRNRSFTSLVVIFWKICAIVHVWRVRTTTRRTFQPFVGTEKIVFFRCVSFDRFVCTLYCVLESMCFSMSNLGQHQSHLWYHNRLWCDWFHALRWQWCFPISTSINSTKIK